MKKFIIRKVALILFLICTTYSFSSDFFKVCVTFDAFDENKHIMNLAGSYISRELRSLNDVIVDLRYDWQTNWRQMNASNPDWRIHIMVSQLRTTDGVEVGIVISATVLSGTSTFIHQSLRAGSLNDLKIFCEAIVASFDSQFLSEDRKENFLENWQKKISEN